MHLFKKKRDPECDPTSLVSILMELGWVSKDQASTAYMTKQDELIGQQLVKMHAITAEQLEEALYQQALKRGEVSQKQAVERTLKKQASMHDKLIEGFNELTNMSTSLTNTGKFAAIKRSK